MRDPSLAPAANPIAGKDAAETFAESDVTVTEDSIFLKNESYELGREEDMPESSPSVDTSSTYINRLEAGFVINPNVDCNHLVITGSSGMANHEGAKLERVSDGVVLDETTDVSPPIRLRGNMTSGNKFAVYFYDSGGNLEYHVENTSFPVSTSSHDVVEAWEDGTGGTQAGNGTYGGGITGIKADTIYKSGKAWVEWPKPNDIYRWDAATFQRTTNGETVDIYVEESSDGGSTWTEISGPIQRGQEISADPANECRFRVDISRADTANDPTIDALYRRWIV